MEEHSGAIVGKIRTRSSPAAASASSLVYWTANCAAVTYASPHAGVVFQNVARARQLTGSTMNCGDFSMIIIFTVFGMSLRKSAVPRFHNSAR